MDILKREKKNERFLYCFKCSTVSRGYLVRKYILVVAVQQEHAVNSCNIVALQIWSVTGCSPKCQGQLQVLKCEG